MHHKATLFGLLTALLVSAAPLQAQTVDDKIKHYIMIDLADDHDRLWLDRWYMTYHAPERRQVVRNYQRHYLSYMTYDIVPDFDSINRIRGRMTEIHFDSLADFYASRLNNEMGEFHTPPANGGGWFETTTATISTNPTEVFIGGFPRPVDHPYFRWIVFYSYPEGVEESVAEAWYLQQHGPELAELPGLLRFVSYRTLGRAREVQRVSELWFETYQDWKQAVIDSPPDLSAPPWGGSFPFMTLQSAFIGERPDVDFMNDHRVIP